MTRLAIIDEHEITVTPVFKMLEIENIPKSETAGHAVMEIQEVVEVRFAGSKNYAPVFPSQAFWKREGNRVITYAERWPDQYRAFKEGNPQEANGTPLEMLRAHGITPEQLSLCRALRIYSIEALHSLEGPNLKSLGINQNMLKQAAREFMANRSAGVDAMGEIETLKAQIAALMAERSTIPPVVEPTPIEVAQIIQQADDAYADMTDDDLKVEISKFTGSKPRGTPSRATLIHSLEELRAA